MGCLFSFDFFHSFLDYFRGTRHASNSAASDDTPKQYSWDTRPKVDPKEFSIVDLKGETVLRMPSTLNGTQFIIQNLENCVVYLFDHIAQLSIDDCKNCKFFVGPSKGSVFIRDCEDCSLALICQQFRTRDCKRITSFMLCSTQPIIESSTNMKFGCISVNYAELYDHLIKANISPFNNNWNNVHDFTPISGEENYSLLNKNVNIEDFIPMPEAAVKSQLNLRFNRNKSVIPYTIGTAHRTSTESCLVVLFVDSPKDSAASKQTSHANNIISTVCNNYPNVVLVQTKRFPLSELSAENVFGSKNYNANLQKGPIIGLEFNGDNCTEIIQSIIASQNVDLFYISQPTAQLDKQLDNFYNFASMQMAV